MAYTLARFIFFLIVETPGTYSLESSADQDAPMEVASRSCSTTVAAIVELSS